MRVCVLFVARGCYDISSSFSIAAVSCSLSASTIHSGNVHNAVLFSHIIRLVVKWMTWWSMRWTMKNGLVFFLIISRKVTLCCYSWIVFKEGVGEGGGKNNRLICSLSLFMFLWIGCRIMIPIRFKSHHGRFYLGHSLDNFFSVCELLKGSKVQKRNVSLDF